MGVLLCRWSGVHLIPSARLYFCSDPPVQWYLLHDNDKKFTSNVVKELLHRLGVM